MAGFHCPSPQILCHRLTGYPPNDSSLHLQCSKVADRLRGPGYLGSEVSTTFHWSFLCVKSSLRSTRILCSKSTRLNHWGSHLIVCPVSLKIKEEVNSLPLHPKPMQCKQQIVLKNHSNQAGHAVRRQSKCCFNLSNIDGIPCKHTIFSFSE